MSSVRRRRLIGCQLVAGWPLIVSNRLGEYEPITSLIPDVHGALAKLAPFREAGRSSVQITNKVRPPCSHSQLEVLAMADIFACTERNPARDCSQNAATQPHTHTTVTVPPHPGPIYAPHM
jgi:hypothetical protein